MTCPPCGEGALLFNVFGFLAGGLLRILLLLLLPHGMCLLSGPGSRGSLRIGVLLPGEGKLCEKEKNFLNFLLTIRETADILLTQNKEG